MEHPGKPPSHWPTHARAVVEEARHGPASANHVDVPHGRARDRLEGHAAVGLVDGRAGDRVAPDGAHHHPHGRGRGPRGVEVEVPVLEVLQTEAEGVAHGVIPQLDGLGPQPRDLRRRNHVFGSRSLES